MRSDLSQSRASFEIPVTSRASEEVHFVKVPSSKACRRDVLMPGYCRGHADVSLASVRKFDAGSDQCT